MNFVMSYSCGKDSTLALHKMIEQGHKPVALLVMVNENIDRSFFHGADYAMLEAYSKCLELPLLITPSEGERYHLAMEESLRKAKAMGAEAACFGDIDIEGNRMWAEERCANAELEAVFPLWQRNREENVYELVELGYRCLIKSINNTLLPKSILGKFIDDVSISMMKDCGIDICGENGEYHTLVVDGPIFKEKLPYQTGKLIDFGDFSIVDVFVE
ncbi:MAG: diphthine--ammonia ligase [Firmicutes bacterium]|nr:diphthine--ammonia ligase [Bacillota bacterium]